MADLPPRSEWIATGNSLTRWRPIVDLIEVHQTVEGKRIRLRLDGAELEIDLNQASADRLAAMLSGRLLDFGG